MQRRACNGSHRAHGPIDPRRSDGHAERELFLAQVDRKIGVDVAARCRERLRNFFNDGLASVSLRADSLRRTARRLLLDDDDGDDVDQSVYGQRAVVVPQCVDVARLVDVPVVLEQGLVRVLRRCEDEIAK